ncbi:MAG: hypothetical protein V7K47_23675 [Nostoc sp.]
MANQDDKSKTDLSKKELTDKQEVTAEGSLSASTSTDDRGLINVLNNVDILGLNNKDSYSEGS